MIRYVAIIPIDKVILPIIRRVMPIAIAIANEILGG